MESDAIRRTMFEAGQVAGSATRKQSTTVSSLKVKSEENHLRQLMHLY